MSNQETTPIAIPKYKQRLNARRVELQAEANALQAKVQTDVKHLSANAPQMIGRDVMSKVGEINPLLAKMVGLSTPAAVRGNRQASNSATGSILNGALKVILPILLSLGSQKILSHLLRATGRTVRFLIGRFFEIGRTRRGSKRSKHRRR